MTDKPQTTPSFRITGGKGFQITFANGWMISTQFGAGSYTEKNRLRQLRADNFSEESQIKLGAEGSQDAEIMIFPPEGISYDEENPIGWQTPEQFADIVIVIRSKT